MKLFLDSANINEIHKAKSLGIIDGCTTNPSLVAREKLKSGKKFMGIIKEICKELGGKQGPTPTFADKFEQAEWESALPVSVEVLKTDATGMCEEGLILSQIASNVVVKLPCTEDGLIACSALSSQGIKVNMTLCFTPLQALLVAKAGAAYVSPFIGRIDDRGENGLQLLANIRMIYGQYGYKTEILAASIRNLYHLTECARIGVDIATIPFNVISKMMESDLTTKGLQIFLDDAKNASTVV